MASSDSPWGFELWCEVCGKKLIRTGSGYLSCPMGHGRLQIETRPEQGGLYDDDPPGTEEASGLWFEE